LLFLCVLFHDWNHDGKRDTGDEWIELYNASNKTIDLSGWQLDDAKSGSAPFTIPNGSTVPPHGFLVFFASETTIGLNNGGDTVRLLHPDDTLADKKQYDPIETNASYARHPDGSETWVTYCVPTPGIANCSQQPAPTPTRQFDLTRIADARQLPDGARVSVLGSVVAHPCEMDTYGHELTLSDGVAGITVFLEFPARFSCALPRNEQIVVTGVLRDHFGMRTLYPGTSLNIARHYAPPREIAPLQIHTGDLNQDTESMLVMIQGQVSNGKNGDVIWVNDGTGIVEVYADPVSGASFEGIPRGSIVRIYGIAYQSNKNKLPTEGYYLRPRAPDDVIVLERAEKLPRAPGNRGGVDLGAVSIEQALSTRTQNYVTVGGIVTVPPGLLSERDFWIQDAAGRGAHIFVAASAGQPPKLELHQNVSVRGRVVSSLGAREIRVELPDAIGTFGIGAAVYPRALRTGEIDFSNEGALIELQGFVARAKGREIYVDDGSGEILVYIDAGTHIRWSRPDAGDPVRIAGILTRFRGEPEILPRYPSDVQFGTLLSDPAAGIDNSAFRALRASGLVGEDLAITRKLNAQAAARLPRKIPRIAPTPTVPTLKQKSLPPASVDLLALVSLLFLVGSGVSATIALKKYRAARIPAHASSIARSRRVTLIDDGPKGSG
jgi:uncharacterized protein YdeI (BOF family)